MRTVIGWSMALLASALLSSAAYELMLTETVPPPQATAQDAAPATRFTVVETVPRAEPLPQHTTTAPKARDEESSEHAKDDSGDHDDEQASED